MSQDSYFLPKPILGNRQASLPETTQELNQSKDATTRFSEKLPSYLKEKFIEILALRGIVDQDVINRFIIEKIQNRPGLNIFISSDEVRAKKSSIDAKLTESFSNEDEDIITVFLGSFIGRANPPHNGHIMTMLQVVEEALKLRGSALLLLGSGPGKKANDKNPIPFDLKRLFIIFKLIEELEKIKNQGAEWLQGLGIPSLFISGQIRIQEMGNQVEQHRAFFIELANKIELQTNLFLQSVLYVGDKEDDSTKLKFVPDSLIKKGIVDEDGNTISIEAKIEALAPIETSTGEAMSATIVRKYAVDHSLDEFRVFLNGHFNIFPPIEKLMIFLPPEEQANFNAKYGQYIKNKSFDFADAFWNIIREENAKAIEEALNPAKKSKSKKGGFKTRRKNQSKRKQTKRKQTKKRRKRQTKKR